MGMGGKADIGVSSEHDLRLDNTFAEFIRPDFSVSEFASSALAGASVSAQVDISSIDGSYIGSQFMQPLHSSLMHMNPFLALCIRHKPCHRAEHE